MALPVASAPFATPLLNSVAPKERNMLGDVFTVHCILVLLKNHCCVGELCPLVAILCKHSLRDRLPVQHSVVTFIKDLFGLTNTPVKIPWPIFSLQPGSGSLSFFSVTTGSPVSSFGGPRGTFSFKLVTSDPAPSGPCQSYPLSHTQEHTVRL